MQPPKRKKLQPEKAWDIFVTNFLCSIRTKTLLTLLLAFLIFYGAILAIVLTIFPQNFYNSELSDMNTKSRRVNRALKDIGDDLQQFTTQNIAAFDDMYVVMAQFAQDFDFGPMNHFVDQYWGPSVFTQWNLDFGVYYFVNGTKFLDRRYDQTTGTFATYPLPKILESFPFALFDRENGMNRREMGFVFEGDVGYFVTAVPIQTTSFEGPIDGVIISGRKLSGFFVNELALRTQMCLSVYLFDKKSDWYGVNATNIPASFYNTPIVANITVSDWQNADMQYVSVLKSISNDTGKVLNGRYCYPSSIEDPVAVSQISTSADRLQGFNLYSDISGNNGLIIRVDVNRTTNDLAGYSIMVVLLILGAVGIIFFFILEVLLEFLILFKMTRLSLQIKGIRDGLQSGEKDDSVNRVTIPFGSDEIQYLSKEVNIFLAEIHDKSEQLKSYVNRLGSEEGATRNMVNSLPDSVVIYDPATDKIETVNSTFEKMFFSQKDLESKTILDILPSVADNKNFRDGKIHNLDIVAVGKFGTKIPVIVSSVALPVSGGEDVVKVTKNMVVIRDAREKEESEAKLRAQMKQAEIMKKQLDFEEQFNNTVIQRALILFCKKEQTVENVYLLIDIDGYKKKDQSHRVKYQKKIFERYLKDGAQHAVNISKDAREDAIKKSSEGIGQIDLFHGLEKAIKFNLVNESFSRFQAVKNDYIDEVLKEMEDQTKNKSNENSNSLSHKPKITVQTEESKKDLKQLNKNLLLGVDGEK